jgi:hypothetical protein
MDFNRDGFILNFCISVIDFIWYVFVWLLIKLDIKCQPMHI